MRHAFVAIALVAVGALAASHLVGPVFARGGAVAEPPRVDRGTLSVERRLKALETEVAYLRSREEAVSRYVLANSQRSTHLQQLAADLVRLGFTARAVPAESREALVAGLRGVANSLSEGLPYASKEERLMLDEVEETLRGR